MREARRIGKRDPIRLSHYMFRCSVRTILPRGGNDGSRARARAQMSLIGCRNNKAHRLLAYVVLSTFYQDVHVLVDFPRTRYLIIGEKTSPPPRLFTAFSLGDLRALERTRLSSAFCSFRRFSPRAIASGLFSLRASAALFFRACVLLSRSRTRISILEETFLRAGL